jgi:hypothetical protein
VIKEWCDIAGDYALEFLEKVTPDSKKTMGQFVSIVNVVLHLI